MKLQSVRFGLACALAFAALWIICTLLVWLSPSSMATVSSHMLHLEGSHFSFSLTLIGIVTGLVSWSLVAGISGVLIAMIYNKISSEAGYRNIGDE